MEYLLVVKRRCNDYIPIEWKECSYYNNENLHTLEGIDAFTRKINSIDLLKDLLNHRLIDPEEIFQSFSIIYNKNGKIRELKDGTIFKENNVIFSEEDLIKIIIKNRDNKILINKIYNICNFKDEDQILKNFRFILNNMSLFVNQGLKTLYAALSLFKDLPYRTKRSIILRFTDKILADLTEEEINITN